MGMICAKLWRSRAFRLGLAVRLLAAAFVVPQVQQSWFVPFVRHWILAPSADPWSGFLSAGSDPLSFPYGIGMFLFHLPFVAAGLLIEWMTRLSGLEQTGFALSLLTADFALLLALCRLDEERTTSFVYFYWLSPLVLYITYWHGQTDIVPTLLVVVSLLLIRERQFEWAGFVFALALAAKLSAVIPLPFVLLFLWKNRRNRQGLKRFSTIGALACVALQVPMLFSQGYRTMVLDSPEITRVYDIAITLSSGASLYLVPTLYLLLLYWAWQIGRMSFEMLFAFLGVSYFLILLATPASVGWFLWVVPFLAFFQTVSGQGPRLMIGGFSVILVMEKLLVASGATIPVLGIDLRTPLLAVFGPYVPARTVSLAISALTATGLIICVTMVQRALRDNDFFRLSRRPLILGIAGDSGSGKDTLSAALAGLFGDHSVASVSGDDYHRFERSSPMWQTVTHLDPRANDLTAFASDCLSLVQGKRIRYRRYDHKTGLFTRRQHRQTNDVLLVSGLHALYPDNLRVRMDLRIFLDMDEDLRKFLKMRRDVAVRGHSRETVQTSMDRRRADYERFVQPQKEHADVVFSLQAASPERLQDSTYDGPIPMCLRIGLRTLLRCDELVRVLTSLCGIQAEVVPPSANSSIDLFVQGDELRADDAQAAAHLLVPHIEELLDNEPQWKSGTIGVMQIVVLMLIAERAKEVRA
jgi:uridine kinase